MARFARGPKCGCFGAMGLSRTDANNFSFRSDESARPPMPTAQRPKNWRRVTRRKCSEKRAFTEKAPTSKFQAPKNFQTPRSKRRFSFVVHGCEDTLKFSCFAVKLARFIREGQLRSRDHAEEELAFFYF